MAPKFSAKCLAGSAQSVLHALISISLCMSVHMMNIHMNFSSHIHIHMSISISIHKSIQMNVCICVLNECLYIPRIICSNICTNIPLYVHNSVTLKGVFIWIFTQIFIFTWAFTHMNICISVPGSVPISPMWNTREEEKTCFWAGGSGLAADLQCVFVGQPLHLAWSRTDLWFVVWGPSPEGSHLHQQIAVIPGAGHHCPRGPEARPHPLPAVQAHPRPQGLIRWGVAAVQGGGTGLACLPLVVMELLPPGGMDLPAAFSQWPQTHLERHSQAQCPLLSPMPFCPLLRGFA